MTTIPAHTVNLICPNCRTWTLGTPTITDKYCSWCGSAIVDSQPLLLEKEAPAAPAVLKVESAKTPHVRARSAQSRKIALLQQGLPELRFPDFAYDSSTNSYELKTWALAGRDRDLPVRLENVGKQPLEIYAVEATRELEHLMRKSPALPVRLAPHETVTFHFMLDMRTVAAAEMNKGLLAFRFRAKEKNSEHTTQVALHVETRAPRPFDGIAVLDFGASHSCLAVNDQTQSLKTAGCLLEKDGETLVPSAVLYHRVDEGKNRIYEIGRAATAQKKRILLEDLKRTLHYEQPLHVLDGQASATLALTPGTMVADYLRALLHAAEDQLAEKKFAREQQNEKEADFSTCMMQDMLVACPSTFTFQQKQALRQALSECGVSLKAESFQSTAAMACLSELNEIAVLCEGKGQNAAGVEGTHHVLAYDLGAVFTDMALVRFDPASTVSGKGEAEAASHIRIKILGVDGDDQFGGNNVTAALAKYLAQQFVAHFERKLGASPQLPLWHHAGVEPGKKIEQIGLLNWKHLMLHAESLKQKLAAEPAAQKKAAQNITLQMISGKKLQTASLASLAVQADFLEKIVAERLQLHLRKMQNLLRTAGLETPDLIYLSGRSAILPAVRRTIGAAFDSRVVFAGELSCASNTASPESATLEKLKTSVALGGVQYFHLLRSGRAFSK